MLKVITKLVTLIYLPFALAMVIAFGEASSLVFIAFHDSFFAALVFALLGIERTLALPFGKRLLHVYLVYVCNVNPGLINSRLLFFFWGGTISIANYYCLEETRRLINQGL